MPDGRPGACAAAADDHPKGITEVIESGLGVEVFVGEDFINGAVFAWMVGDYWAKYHSAPSLDAIEEQFRGTDQMGVRARIAGADCEDGHLIERLQLRFIVNQLQEIVMDAAKTAFSDPGGTVTALREATTRLDELMPEPLADVLERQDSSVPGWPPNCGGSRAGPSHEQAPTHHRASEADEFRGRDL